MLTIETSEADQELLSSLIEKQNNKCNICFSPHHWTTPFVVDYCSATKKPLGALCLACMSLIAMSKRSTTRLRRAAWHVEQLRDK